MAGRTLYDQMWEAHLVAEDEMGESLIYVDLHLLNEVTSPQAFAGLREAGRTIRRPDRCLAVADHNTPTEGQALGIARVADPEARIQLETLASNATAANIPFFGMAHPTTGLFISLLPSSAVPYQA